MSQKKLELGHELDTDLQRKSLFILPWRDYYSSFIMLLWAIYTWDISTVQQKKLISVGTHSETPVASASEGISKL